jgi:adenylosuccinate synthase
MFAMPATPLSAHTVDSLPTVAQVARMPQRTLTTLAIVGGQWGDEGKAKLVDVLAQQAQAVVRTQGGCNAGHTVCHHGQTFKFHHVPTGVLHKGVASYLGNGVVIHPPFLQAELNQLRSQGLTLDEFFISPKAHVTLPFHCEADHQAEAHSGAFTIGTTGRGIGPTYQAKVGRYGLRVADLLEDDAWLAERIAYLAQPYPNVPLPEVMAWVKQAQALLLPYVADVTLALHAHVAQGHRVLFEGAQGSLLDVDFGTYPYVTSSNATTGGACTGSGLGPTQLDAALGIFKAYVTRVGEGPFPTELHDEGGERLRTLGHEVGTTTGRPRRCGWFDAVLARYAVAVNGLTHLALTKVDVLDSFAELPICVGYRLGESDTVLNWPPDRQSDWAKLTPVYEVMAGWQNSTLGITQWDDLPPACQAYLRRLEELAGCPLAMVSTGPDRDAIINVRPLW